MLLRENVTCWGDINMSQWNKSINLGTGSLTAGSLILNGTTHTSIGGPTLLHFDLSNKPADGTSIGTSGHFKVVCGNGSSGENAQTYRLKLPSAPNVGDTVEVHALANIHFQLPVEGSVSLWAAVHNAVHYSQQIKYTPGTHPHGFITYVEKPGSSGTQHRWLSTHGVLS